MALGLPNFVAGVWAVLAPRNWYENFLGWDPHLVGGTALQRAPGQRCWSGSTCFRLVLVVAAWLGDQRSARLAIVGFAAFAVSHAAYHVANVAPGLSGVENVLNAGVLVFAVVVVTGRYTMARLTRRAEI